MMKLHEWEIWHTYSTYIESTDINLADCAERLIERGLAEFVTLRSGESFWRTPEGVGKGTSSVELDLVSGGYSYQLKLNKGTEYKPKGFALEAFVQAIQFLAGEQMVLGPESS